MKKTVLITGATGTIGKAASMELANQNCHLILLGRNSRKLSAVRDEIIKATTNNHIDIVVADLSEPQSVLKATAEIKSKYTSLNTLINVAAVFRRDRLENSMELEYMFATNHLGPFILTYELLDLLKSNKPSRVITVSAPSTTKIKFGDLQGKKKFSAGFMGAFGASKMMNLMFTYSLAQRLEGTGVTANVFHPGLVKSDLTREMPALMNFIFKKISSKPDKAAKMLCKLAIDEEYKNSNGKFLTLEGKELKPNTYSQNKDLQEKLWTLSEEFINNARSIKQ